MSTSSLYDMLPHGVREPAALLGRAVEIAHLRTDALSGAAAGRHAGGHRGVIVDIMCQNSRDARNALMLVSSSHVPLYVVRLTGGEKVQVFEHDLTILDEADDVEASTSPKTTAFGLSGPIKATGDRSPSRRLLHASVESSAPWGTCEDLPPIQSDSQRTWAERTEDAIREIDVEMRRLCVAAGFVPVGVKAWEFLTRRDAEGGTSVPSISLWTERGQAVGFHEVLPIPSEPADLRPSLDALAGEKKRMAAELGGWREVEARRAAAGDRNARHVGRVDHHGPPSPFPPSMKSHKATFGSSFDVRLQGTRYGM